MDFGKLIKAVLQAHASSRSTKAPANYAERFGRNLADQHSMARARKRAGVASAKGAKRPGKQAAPREHHSSSVEEAFDQLGSLTAKTVEQQGVRLEKYAASMAETAKALGDDVVAGLKILEQNMVSQPTKKASDSPASNDAVGGSFGPSGSTDKKDDSTTSAAAKGGVMGFLLGLVRKNPAIVLLSLGVAGIEYGKNNHAPARQAKKYSPAYWMGVDPTESREDRLKRLQAGKGVDNYAPNEDGMFHSLGRGILSLFSAKGWEPGKEIKAKSIEFEAKKMTFDFKQVGQAPVAAGGSDGSGIGGTGGGTDQQEDYQEPSGGQMPMNSGRDGGAQQRRLTQTQDTPEVKKKGISFSNPTQDPAKQPLTGGKPQDTAGLLPEDKVKDFWKDRNPAGAKIYDKVGKPMVNPQLLHSEAAGIKAFEAANPQYHVQAYGPASGERESGSTANHGKQRDGMGAAMDVVIIDKKTGQMLTNNPGKQHQHQGTVGENAPVYQKLYNSTVAAAGKLYPGTEDMYRYGGYFQGDNPMDLMHIDRRAREAGMGGGNLMKGFTSDQMSRWGIPDNQGYKDANVQFAPPVQATTVSTAKMPGSPLDNPGFAASVQPQGSFQPPPPAKPDMKPPVVVKNDSDDSSKGDRVRPKKFKEHTEAAEDDHEQLRFSQYLNVENDEEK